AVEDDGLAVGFDLLAAPRPEVRVPKRGGVTKGVAERLTQGTTLGLELLAGGAVFIPGLREFPVAVADLLEPGFAVGQQAASGRPRHPDPPVADCRGLATDLVIAALRPADLVDYVADIDDTVGIELRPGADQHDDVGTGSGLDCGRDP